MNIKNVFVLAAMSLFSIAITQSASAVEFITNGGFETGKFHAHAITPDDQMRLVVVARFVGGRRVGDALLLIDDCHRGFGD